MAEKQYLKCIYGAGKYGELLLQLINVMGGGVDYFVQTNEPECKEVKGTPVISFKSMMSIKADKIVFIAMNDSKAIREIEKNIYAQSDPGTVKIYNCKDFIKDNLVIQHNEYSQGTRKCVVCGNNIAEFCPGGISEGIFAVHHIIGGGYRRNCKCPHCGTIDRVRWQYYVLENYTDISRIAGRVLHFAPERVIETYIKRNEQIDYYGCDIVQGKAMHVVDITDIPYRDNTFDYVICNHVMEHIVDEKRAVSEIKRVLKGNGKFIFSFPICADMKTYEDKAIATPEQRLKAYGQKDHVRLYGNDFVERFERYGLKIEIYSPKDKLDDTLIDKYGFIEDDIIMVATQSEKST